MSPKDGNIISEVKSRTLNSITVVRGCGSRKASMILIISLIICIIHVHKNTVHGPHLILAALHYFIYISLLHISQRLMRKNAEQAMICHTQAGMEKQYTLLKIERDDQQQID